MADDKRDFEVWLKSRFDGDALKAAQESFERTKVKAQEAKTGLQALGDEAKKLGWTMETVSKAMRAAFVEILAVAEVMSQLKTGFSDAVDMEAMLRSISGSAKKYGEDAAEAVKATKDLAEHFRTTAGIAEDQTVKAMRNAYVATGSLESSLKYVALAADIATAKFKGDLAPAMDLVMAAANGKTRALQQLWLTLGEGELSEGKAAAAMQLLVDKFGGAAEKARGLNAEMRRLNAAWDATRESLLGGAVPATTKFLELLNRGVIVAQWVGDNFGSVFRLMGSQIATVGRIWGDPFGGHEKEFAENWQRALNERLAATQRYVERMTALIGAQEGTASGKRDVPPGNTGGKDDKGGPGGRDSANENWRADLAQMEREFKARQKLEDDAVQLGIKRRQKELADEKHQKDQLRHLGDKALADYRKGQEEMVRINAERILMAIEAEKAKAKAMNAAMAGLINTLGEAFGFQKELSIAQATISTYEGAAKALGQGGIYGVALAAVVIATGLAQVAQIVATNAPGGGLTGVDAGNYSAYGSTFTGGGFDDPANDRAAYLGGRRWAADMVGEFSRGVSQGWAAQMGATTNNSSTTNDNRRTYNVHLHGAGLIDPANQQMARQLQRTLSQVDAQFEGQRTVARLAK